MANSAPGKHYREGISLGYSRCSRIGKPQKNGLRTADGETSQYACIADHTISSPIATTKQCRTVAVKNSCAKKFSVKTGTFMQGSNLAYQTWAIAIYLMVTGIKGVSSMNLHRDF